MEQKGYIGKEIIMGIRPGDMRLLAERETEKDAGDGEIRGEFLETEDLRRPDLYPFPDRGV